MGTSTNYVTLSGGRGQTEYGENRICILAYHIRKISHFSVITFTMHKKYAPLNLFYALLGISGIYYSFREYYTIYVTLGT